MRSRPHPTRRLPALALLLALEGALVACGDSTPGQDLSAGAEDLARSLPPLDGGVADAEPGPAPPPLTCFDGERDGDETDVDCGGPCRPCTATLRCKTAEDCGSMVCAANGRCVSPATCRDELLSTDETDVDCGGPACAQCGKGQRCRESRDCSTHVCGAGRCTDPMCDDGIKDGDETDVDCGGFGCKGCGPGQACQFGHQCATGICTAAGTCAAPSCTDQRLNGDETDVDCGGSCAPCGLGQRCIKAGDCASGLCTNLACDLVVTPLAVTPAITGASSLDTVDGSTLYLTAPNWSAYVSKDAGQTWDLKYDATSANLKPDLARLHVGRADPNEILIYASNPQGSTYDATLVVSHDGLATATVNKLGLSTWGTATAFSPTDAKTVYLFGDNGGAKVSSTGGDATTTITPTPKFGTSGLWYPGPAAVSPTRASLSWILVGGFGSVPTFYTYDATDKLVLEHSGEVALALGGQSPAGFEQYAKPGGGHRLRFVGSRGAVATSDDEGKSYVNVGAFDKLTACSRARGLVSAPADRSRLATWCAGGELALSKDGGVTWAKITAPSWTGRSCTISDVALAGGRVLVACRATPPLSFAY